MGVQRILLDGQRTWTVTGDDHLPAGPVEEYLEFLRVAQQASPNTVRSYAASLAMDRRDMLDLLQLDRRTDRILPNGYCLLPRSGPATRETPATAATTSRPTAAISPRSAVSSPPPSSSSTTAKSSAPPATASR